MLTALLWLFRVSEDPARKGCPIKVKILPRRGNVRCLGHILIDFDLRFWHVIRGIFVQAFKKGPLFCLLVFARIGDIIGWSFHETAITPLDGFGYTMNCPQKTIQLINSLNRDLNESFNLACYTLDSKSFFSLKIQYIYIDSLGYGWWRGLPHRLREKRIIFPCLLIRVPRMGRPHSVVFCVRAPGGLRVMIWVRKSIDLRRYLDWAAK